MAYKTGNSTHAPDSEAVRIIAALFMSSDDVVCDLLDDAGIIPVPYPDKFDIEAFEQAYSNFESTTQRAEHSPVRSEAGSPALKREERSQSTGESVSSPGFGFLSPTPTSSFYRSNDRTKTLTYRQT